MIDPDILLAFRQIDVLKDLSTNSQKHLASYCSRRPIRKGETLFCQGEPSPYCYGILHGKVTVKLSDPSCEHRYGVGSFLCGPSLLADQLRPGLASVTEDGELISVWASRFRASQDTPEKLCTVQEIQRALTSYP